MHCDGCARTIEAIVATEPGVRKAIVSYDSCEAHLRRRCFLWLNPGHAARLQFGDDLVGDFLI